MRIANIESMKRDELEALEASIIAELQSRDYEANECFARICRSVA
jgi:hypothetical protein